MTGFRHDDAIYIKELTTEPCITTYSGRLFYPLSPRIEDIELEDIIHSLPMKCRFTCQVKWFLSVAQHSVMVSDQVSEKNVLCALLHDATEAYLPDIATPIKPHIPGFVGIEDRLYSVIALKFGLPDPIPEEVHKADKRMRATEDRDLMTQVPAVSGKSCSPSVYLPYRLRVIPWNMAQAELYFREALDRAFKCATP